MRILRASIALLALAIWAGTGAVSCAKPPDSGLKTTAGGKLTATYRSEPRSFNRYVSADVAEDLIARLIHTTLVRVDRTTGKVEPRLAREWSTSADGLTWIFKLEENVTFSDGAPFTSADVVFSFRALYDPKVASDLAASLRIGGQPMQVRAMDAHTVSIVFPETYGPGISLLDALPILPEHKLRAALDAGTFREAWGVTTAGAEMPGLGPFVIQEYVPGQRLVFARNPKFWRRDATGQQLPYIDQLELQFTPDQNTEVLRLQAGETDLMTDKVRLDDLTSLKNAAARGTIALHSAGVSIAPDMLWFNLNPGATSVVGRSWLQRDELRLAISDAVNRTTIVNTVFLGEAVEISGPITPGHGEWFSPDLSPPSFDPAQASKRLAAIGLIDRDGDGLLEDARGKTASFTVRTIKGNTIRERSLEIIKDQLRKVGLKVDVVALDGPAFGSAVKSGDYDAMYMAVEPDSLDPGRHLDFWLSSGPFHFWNPSQRTPATPWEARIDDLMTKQSTSVDRAERLRLFAEVQRVFAEHKPVVYFAAPNVTVATSARVGGVKASILAPSVLWNAERLFLRASSDLRR